MLWFALYLPNLPLQVFERGAEIARAHYAEWAEKPVRRRWAEIYGRFDLAVAPSRFRSGLASFSPA